MELSLCWIWGSKTLLWHQSSSSLYGQTYRLPWPMYSSIFDLAVLVHVMVSTTGKGKTAMANLENALFPQMLNFLMCTINHKSPNISIQYCLPTCLVGFHCTKSWQLYERGALIGGSSPQLRITANHRAALSGVCKSGRQAVKTKSENSIERLFLFLAHRWT